MSPRQIPLGVIISAHGIRGLVKVKTEASDFKAKLEERPVSIGNNACSAKVVGATTSPFIVQIKGVEDRNAAEALKGEKIYITAKDTPAPDAAEFVVDELIGISVEENGASIGTITRMFNFGAGEIAEITYVDGKTEMFPFNARTFPAIDLASKQATFKRPEEL